MPERVIGKINTYLHNYVHFILTFYKKQEKC